MATSMNPVRALLDGQDWGDVHARLVNFAFHRSKSMAHAKDLAQEAITRVFAYDSKWDPAKDPDLVTYLMSVVNSLLSNDRTRAGTKRTASMNAKGNRHVREAAEAVADANAFSEERATEIDLQARRLAVLTRRFAGDAEAARVLELRMEGVDTPAEIRARTGWPARTVDLACRRVSHAAAIVAREIRVAGDEPALLAAAEGAATDEESELAP